MFDQSTKLEKLKSLLKLVDESISRADFEKSFGVLIDFVKKIQTANSQEREMIENKYDTKVDEIMTDCQGDMEKAKKMMMAYCEKEMNVMLAEHEAMLAVMDKKMAEIHDGKDADETVVAEKASNLAITAVLDKVVAKDDFKGEISKLGDLIADTISGLLEVEDIKGLKEALEELRKLRTQRLGGGGFSALAMQQHFIFKENPTGAVNGVNKDFVLNHTPSPTNSLTVYRGGAVQTLTEDYTISNKTIAFIVAPVEGEIIRCDYLI